MEAQVYYEAHPPVDNEEDEEEQPEIDMVEGDDQDAEGEEVFQVVTQQSKGGRSSKKSSPAKRTPKTKTPRSKSSTGRKK